MRIVLLAFLFVCLAAPAQAQKLYRWTDKDGKEHYSDTLPAEAIDSARAELSKSSGSTVGEVARALTDEERAQQAAAAQAAADQARLEEESLERDRALLGSYPSEGELQRAYTERLLLLDEAVKSAQVGIDAQHAALGGTLAHATDLELAGRPVDARTLGNLRELHAQLVQQQEQLSRREAERIALKAEFEQTLARYRELRDNPPPGLLPAGHG